MLGLVHSLGLDKCIMMCVHHCSIIQSSFTALNILCAVYSSFPHPSLWQPLISFTFSIVLAFLECHIVRIIHYAAFQMGFFRLVYALRFLHVFQDLIAHFLVLTNIPLSGCTSSSIFFFLIFIYLFGCIRS